MSKDSPKTPPATRLLRQPQVLEMTGIKSKSTLWRWILDGSFPRPIKIGPRASAWPLETIQVWIAEKQAASTPLQEG